MKRIGSFILLVILVGQPSFSEESSTFVPPLPSGRYSSGISIENPLPGELQYRFVSSSGHGHTEFYLPLERNLYLDAPEGSSVSYHLEYRTDSNGMVHGPFTYIIDRLPPAPPIPETPPGVYGVPLPIHFGESLEDDVTYRYALQVDRSGSGDTDDAKGLFYSFHGSEELEITGAAGQVMDYTVFAYAVDGAGNRSEIRGWPYRIDRIFEPEEPQKLIISPVEGQFANEQLLLVDSRSFTSINVELHTPEGVQKQPYIGEFLVPGEGEFTITATATVRGTEEAIVETVQWRQRRSNLNVVPSGKYSDSVSVFRSGPPDSFHYNFLDTSVTMSDDRILNQIILPLERDTIRTVVLRLANGSQNNEGDHRYVYVIDGRRSPPPNAVEYQRTIILYSLLNTEIQYRSADSPAKDWNVYRHPIEIDSTLPAGELEVRARYPGAIWGTHRRFDPESLQRTSQTRTEIPESAPAISFRGEIVAIDHPSGVHILRSTDTDIVFEGQSEESLQWRIPRGYQINVVSADGIQKISNVPPAPPEFKVTGQQVQFVSVGELNYRVDGAQFQPLQERTITLSGIDGVQVDQIVEAYAVVEGDISPVARLTVPIDRRNLYLPPLQPHLLDQERDGRFITNQPTFTLSFDNPHEDLLLHYEVGESMFPRDPQNDSPVTRDHIVFEGTEGESREYTVRFRGRYEGRPGWTTERQYFVTVDLDPPDPPILLEPADDGEIFGESGVVRFVEPTDGSRLFYRLHPKEPFRLYSEPFRIHSGDEEVSGYLSIEAYTIDSAGNRSYLDGPVHLSFLSDEPISPRIRINGHPVSAHRIVVEREGLLEIDSFGDDRAFWRVLEQSVTQERPDFQPYVEAILLSAGDGKGRDYTVEVYSESPSGVRSPIRRGIFQIEPSAPPAASAPVIIRDPSANEGTLYWAETAARRVFASFIPGDPVFLETDGLLNWSIPAGSESIQISYFIVDEDNRRSPTESITIERSNVPARPVVSGVTDGGLYRSRREITIAGNGVVRYSLSAGPQRPSPVHALSTLYDGTIILEPGQGEDVQYHLRAAVESSDGGFSPEVSISFRIDRAPPAPPELADIETGSFFADTRDVFFLDPGEKIIYYRVFQSYETDKQTGSNVPFDISDGGPVTLEAVPGSLVHYRIEAYAVDSAGNRSQSVSNWEILIDQEIVYVHESGAGGDGTRQSPVASISEGIDILLRGQRRTLFMAHGNYQMSPEDLSKIALQIDDFSLVGGLDPQTWTPAAGETRLSTREPSTLILSGDVLLQRVTLEPSLSLAVESGAVTIDRTILINGTVEQYGGTTDFHRMIASSVGIRGGEATIRNSMLGSASVQNGATLFITDSTIGSGELQNGGDHIAIRNSESKLSIHDSVIYGRGDFYSNGIFSRRGETVVGGALIMIIRGDEQIGVVSNAGGLSLHDSAILLAGGSAEVSRAIQVRGSGRLPQVMSRLILAGLMSAGDERADASTSALNRHAETSVDRGNVSTAIRLDSDSTIDIEDVVFHGWQLLAARQATGGWGGEEPVITDTQTHRNLESEEIAVLHEVFKAVDENNVIDSDFSLDDIAGRRREIISYLRELLERTFRS